MAAKIIHEITDLSPEQEKLLEKYAAQWREYFRRTRAPDDVKRLKSALKQNNLGDYEIKFVDGPIHLARLPWTAISGFGYEINNYVLPAKIRRKVSRAFSSNIGPFAAVTVTPFAAVTLDRRRWVLGQSLGREEYYFIAKFVSDIFKEVPFGLFDGNKKKINALYNLALSCRDFRVGYSKKIIYVLEHPLHAKFDEQNRMHCDDGPAVQWKKEAVYAHHGVVVDSSIITNPERITLKKIEQEPNIEIKRVMIEKFGLERFLKEKKADIIDHDERWGTLYTTEMLGEDDWQRDMQNEYFLLVINRTAEPDGTFRKYVLRVHPQCRPLPNPMDRNSKYGAVQKMTALNAVASTFGLRGEEYEKLLAAES